MRPTSGYSVATRADRSLAEILSVHRNFAWACATRPHHVSRGMAMIFKAIGLDPQGRLHRLASKAAGKLM